jgi:hypothetical protein
MRPTAYQPAGVPMKAIKLTRPRQLEMTIPLKEQIAEIGQEIILRRSVYPHFISRGQLSPATAERRIERLEAARQTLLAYGAAMASSAPRQGNKAAVATAPPMAETAPGLKENTWAVPLP